MRRLLALTLALLSAACAGAPKRAAAPAPSARLLPFDAWPRFEDAFDDDSLRAAVFRSIEALESGHGPSEFRLGAELYTRAHLVDSLRAFFRIAGSAKDGADLNARLKEEFVVYAAEGPAERAGRAKFTSYYDPTLEASPRKTREYPYPLYARPSDLLEIKLNAFDPSMKTGRLVGRLADGKLVPYYTRAEIDAGALDGRGLEIAWLKSKFDVMDIHIQGSGRLVYPDGTHRRASFAATNNHPFKGWVTLLRQSGALGPEATMNDAKAYLRAHPEILDWVLQSNKRYTFFKLEAIDPAAGPTGSLGVPLTARRSIAIDPEVYPLGVVGFVDVELPVPLEGTDQVRGAVPTKAFVVLQDTGGAIRGPGRADFFAGHGAEAEGVAKRLLAEGRLYLLVKKLR